MKKTVECVFCYELIELSKHSYVYNPMSDRYNHLSCYVRRMTFDVSNAVTKILHDEAKDRGNKEWLKDLKDGKNERNTH